jgi:hypothetical protein
MTSHYCIINDLNNETILNLENLEQIEILVNKLYNEFYNETHDKKFLILKHICNTINLNIDIIDKNIDCLTLVFNFLLEDSAEYLVITNHNENYQQIKQNIKFCDLLNQSVKNDCHNIPGNVEYPFGFRCDYHNESIKTHLLLAMLYTLFYLPEIISQKDKFRYILTSLFHDIGKNPSIFLYKPRQNDKPGGIGYPTHGLQGALIMAQLWENRLDKYFTKNEWENMCDTMLYHMCSYHHMDDENIDKRLTLLKNVCNDDVKKSLFYLSFGDNLGKISTVSKLDKEDLNKVIIERSLAFCNEIQGTKNIEDIIVENSLREKSIFINISGRSGSGKSYTINKLKNILLSNGVFDNDIVIISRDKLLCYIVKEHLKENNDKTIIEENLSNQLNELMIINDELAPENILLNQLSNCILPDKEIRKNIQIYYDKINKKNKEINKLNSKKSNQNKLLTLNERVNNLAKKLIDYSANNNKIIFFDTLALIYSHSMDNMVPNSVKECLKIMIFIVRNELLDQNVADRLGLTINEQLQNHKIKNITNNIFPPTTELNFNNLSAVNELRTYNSLNFNPHYQFYYTWNANNTMGDGNVNKFIENIAKYYSDNQVDKSETEQYENINIVDLINILYAKSLFHSKNLKDRIEFITNFFIDKKFLIYTPSQLRNTEYENKVLFIKYIDGINKEWSLWGRQCRGVILGLFGDNDKWICIKRLLQRGPEVFTGYHIKTGTDDTQDVNSKSIAILNPKHQDVINGILNNKSDDCYLSMKKDGSLVGVHIYLFNSEIGIIMEDIINKYGNEFAKLNLDMCKKLNLFFFIIISTSGTLFIGDNMLPYVVTSIIDGLFRDNDIYDIINLHMYMKPEKVFIPYIKPFIQKINEFYNGLSYDLQMKPMFLSFEAICKNTIDAWKNEHTELASGYEKSSFTFLGVTVNVDETPGLYLAHFDDKINSSMFDVPLYWKTNLNNVTQMIIDLSNVIKGNMSENIYLNLYKPNNIDFNNNDNKYVLDPEGFILYTRDKDTPELLYSKVKTPEYYIAHKLNFDNIKKILELNEYFVNSFPHIKKIKNFNINIKTGILNISNYVKKYFNDLLQELSTDIYGFNEKQLKFYNSSAKLEIKFKSLLNSNSVLIRDKLINVFKLVFPKLDLDDKNDLYSVIKNILIEIKIWLNDNMSFIDEFSNNYSNKNLFNLYTLSQGVISDNNLPDLYHKKYLKYKQKYLNQLTIMNNK